MPLSPPFRPNANGHPTSPPPPTGPLPTLPFEIHRRIIHFRLSQARSYPSPLTERPEASWDDWSGVRGRVAGLKRVEERRDVTRTARGLMAVCKAWKPVVMKYLYSSPYLTDNISSFSRSMLAGDAKWSDINIHQFSIPGRYISFLDLSTISSSVHPIEVRRSVISILGLLPNVTHLKLPSGELPFPMEEIGWGPFAKKLKCLEGVEVDANHLDTGEDALIELLRKLPNLEVLSVVGPADHGPLATLDEVPTHREGVGRSLRLSKLHTLRMEDVKSGNFIAAMIEADLPTLDRLVLTSFFGMPNDLTYALQETHGLKIRSLTYLQGKTWPRSLGFAGAGIGALVPARETMNLHPNLEHLAFLVPDYEQLETLLSSTPAHHPLRWLTIFKWAESPRVAAADGALTPSSDGNNNTNTDATTRTTTNLTPRNTSGFLKAMMTHKHPANLMRINVDGFKWVKSELGRIAMDAGTSGEMRTLASNLSRIGLELGDLDGALAPSGATGMGGGAGGMGSMGSNSIGYGYGNACGNGNGYGPIERGRRRSSGGTIPWMGKVGMMSGVGVGAGGGKSKAEREEAEDEDGG